MAVAHGQRVLEAGEPLASARAAMILLHGRGATAEDILTIAAEVQQPGWAYLAPQAAGNAWYPNPFTAPLESNEPSSPPRSTWSRSWSSESKPGCRRSGPSCSGSRRAPA